MWIDVPPFLPLFLGALLLPFLPRGWPRGLLLLGLPVLGGLNLLGAQVGTHLEVEILGYSLTPFRVDRLSLLFGYLFHIAAFLGNLFALHLGREDRDTVQHASALLYAGSALGAVFAGDLITLFVFWELLALTSTFLIWSRGTRRSVRAGFRYLIIQVVSGVMLLAGALMIYYETGSLAFGYVGLSGAASWLIFLSFALIFPVMWSTDPMPMNRRPLKITSLKAWATAPFTANAVPIPTPVTMNPIWLIME